MAKKIGREEILKATSILHDYQAGKANLDQRIQENEEWFRMQHWHGMRNRRQTGWLHTTIVNKHADFMDNAPEVNVLPREEKDQKTAQALTDILPVVLERGGWPLAYDKASYDKVKFGAGIYSVLWDPNMDAPLGNISIRRAEGLNLYWQPGVEDIQESANLFMLEPMDHEKLRALYPQIKELENLGTPSETIKTYVRQESINDSEKSIVVNWYYKKDGVLHYCRYVQDIVLFATENEKGYEKGWYEDGKYPYVFDPLFYEPESPHGFGLIDTGRDAQEDIDQLNNAMMDNAKIAARRRYFMRENAQINLEEFKNLDADIVHFGGTLDENTMKEIPSELLGGVYVSILQSKIEEIKECTFNRDVNSGGTGGSQTAAGIAALQESGSKSSRAAIAGTYRAFKEIVNMVIERIRQFYGVERVFRIIGDDKQIKFVSFDNRALQPVTKQGISMEFETAEPIFDLDVRVSKQNAWSRQANNADVLQFFNMGFFAPQMATQALACLEVLQIENKDKLQEVIMKNDAQQQFNRQTLPMLLQAAGAVDPQLAAQAAQQAQAAGVMTAPVPEQGAAQGMAKTDVNGAMQRSNSYMEKQRDIAQARTAPNV